MAADDVILRSGFAGMGSEQVCLIASFFCRQISVAADISHAKLPSLSLIAVEIPARPVSRAGDFHVFLPRHSLREGRTSGIVQLAVLKKPYIAWTHDISSIFFETLHVSKVCRLAARVQSHPQVEITLEILNVAVAELYVPEARIADPFVPDLNRHRISLNQNEMAIWKFLGNSVITRLQKGNYKNDVEIRKALQPDTSLGKGYWVDFSQLAGYYGWERLPALTTWRSAMQTARYNEFILSDGLDWNAAMKEIYPPQAVYTPTPVLPPVHTPTRTPWPTLTPTPTRTPWPTRTPSPTPSRSSSNNVLTIISSL